MSRTTRSYCSCSTCTQIRNEQPKRYRYINTFRSLLTGSCCLSSRRLTFEKERTLSPNNHFKTSTITFRDADITNKHCSKHDVMIKASRPHFSKSKNEQLRQRVKDANQRWTRMSRLPINLIDFIFQNEDFLPLCSICYTNLSLLTFNLCHTCISNLLRYQQLAQQRSSPPSTLNDAFIVIASTDHNEEHIPEESISV